MSLDDILALAKILLVRIVPSSLVFYSAVVEDYQRNRVFLCYFSFFLIFRFFSSLIANSYDVIEQLTLSYESRSKA